MRKARYLILISLLYVAAACSNQPASDKNAGKEATPPPATDTTTHDADNTARNADLSTLSQTATAQGESAADLQISAAIRKAVVDDKDLSVNAHNVKIITADGAVTLRGPVKSDREKQSIESKAKQVAGVTRVEN